MWNSFLKFSTKFLIVNCENIHGNMDGCNIYGTIILAWFALIKMFMVVFTYLKMIAIFLTMICDDYNINGYF